MRRRSLIVVQQAGSADAGATSFLPLRLAHALSAYNERLTLIDAASSNALHRSSRSRARRSASLMRMDRRSPVASSVARL